MFGVSPKVEGLNRVWGLGFRGLGFKLCFGV